MNLSRWIPLSAVVCSVLLGAATLGVAGNTVPGWPGDPAPQPVLPTVTVSLSLPGYSLWIDMMPTPIPLARNGDSDISVQHIGDFGSFPAVFKLVNRSGSPLQLELPLTWKPVLFVMRNAEGREVWRSYAPDPRITAPLVLKTVVLETGKSWRVSAKVPLAIKGRPLKPGTYTLEAFVNGTPRYAATAPFEIGYAY